MKTLSAKEAAEYLHVSQDTVKELAASGKLPGAKIGKAWVFTDTHLADYLADEISRQTAAIRRARGATETKSRQRTPPPL
jgi:excisionase family DNA binding protein